MEKIISESSFTELSGELQEIIYDNGLSDVDKLSAVIELLDSLVDKDHSEIKQNRIEA